MGRREPLQKDEQHDRDSARCLQVTAGLKEVRDRIASVKVSSFTLHTFAKCRG